MPNTEREREKKPLEPKQQIRCGQLKMQSHLHWMWAVIVGRHRRRACMGMARPPARTINQFPRHSIGVTNGFKRLPANCVISVCVPFVHFSSLRGISCVLALLVDAIRHEHHFNRTGDRITAALNWIDSCGGNLDSSKFLDRKLCEGLTSATKLAKSRNFLGF